MILAAAVVAAASPAAAVEFEKKSWEVGAYLVRSTYDNDSTISDTFAWGVRGAFIGTPRHEGEFTFEMQSADDATKGSDVTYDITKWTINYLYNIKGKKPESKLATFLLFGAGTMSYDGRGESESSTILQAGAGVRIFFTKRFGMRMDGKIWHFHGDGSGGGTGVPRDGYFAFDATVGVSYLFGGGA
jgi:hypothetical protein